MRGLDHRGAVHRRRLTTSAASDEGVIVRTGPTILIALALSVAGAPVQARDTQSQHAGSFSIGVGTFNMGHSHSSGGFGLEYRLESRSWRPRESGRFCLIPTFGITGTSKEAFFAYAGFRTDLDLTGRLPLASGFAVGA